MLINALNSAIMYNVQYEYRKFLINHQQNSIQSSLVTKNFSSLLEHKFFFHKCYVQSLVNPPKIQSFSVWILCMMYEIWSTGTITLCWNRKSFFICFYFACFSYLAWGMSFAIMSEFVWQGHQTDQSNYTKKRLKWGFIPIFILTK